MLTGTGAYRTGSRTNATRGGPVASGIVATFLVLILLAALTKTTTSYSRLWLTSWILLGTLLLAGSRYLLDRGLPATRVVPQILIIGVGRLAVRTAQQLSSYYNNQQCVLGFLRPEGQQRLEEAGPSLPPLLGSVEELELLLKRPGDGVDEVWIAAPQLSEGDQQRIATLTGFSCVTLRYVPDLPRLGPLGLAPAEIAGMAVIDLNASPLTGANAMIKAAIDRVSAAGLLLVLSPLLILIAVLIRLDSPGPLLFVQQRHGGKGKVIRVLKFRTMTHRPDAEFQQATRADPRVTRIGRFLRRTSLDELPQLINVCRGDMSLVGPRPHPVELNDSYTRRIDAYMQRHRVKPGITGWAQIHGFRGETDTVEKMARRVEYDLYYIRHWSLWLDVQILLLTLLRGWRDPNAF